MHELNRLDPLSTDSILEPSGGPRDDRPELSSDFVLSRQGVWLRKNWTDATFNFCYRGSYPTLLTDYLSKQTREFAFIDVGANQGLYSLIAVQSPWCTQALAFEPVMKTFALLEDNIRANANASKITAFRCAVSDNVGECPISIKVGHSGAATLRKAPSKLLRGSEMIQTVGPAWLGERKPGHPAIIKIDVEGHEEVVLQTLGKAGYLNTAFAVYYEVDDRWSNAARLQEILVMHDFRFFARTRSGKHYDVLATRQKVEVDGP
ncbi:FkbM family methyltransferase [Chromatocurvus halotolerans]|uniref:FkbM family methyltransferase n=1 Tax=Chromatocurvus halotolerans TaxID=1132028 RepID=A0A4R2KBQ2_9GAMM|nr:FkbM family methyltransferase [Chromatocurvus halotolerans]TCO69662.1 FkbM family methyltransferase [Chromatocurvus halotolerans]